jgi:DNA polymerase sigma
MKEPKNSVLDRIEQSFGLLKNNFFALFLSLFLYNIFSVLVFGGI